MQQPSSTPGGVGGGTPQGRAPSTSPGAVVWREACGVPQSPGDESPNRQGSPRSQLFEPETAQEQQGQQLEREEEVQWQQQEEVQRQLGQQQRRNRVLLQANSDREAELIEQFREQLGREEALEAQNKELQAEVGAVSPSGLPVQREGARGWWMIRHRCGLEVWAYLQQMCCCRG